MIQEFLDKWWVELVCSVAIPFLWALAHKWAKKTETKVDDEIVELVDEVVETYKAGKAAKEAPSEPKGLSQPVVSPELTEEQRSQLNSN